MLAIVDYLFNFTSCICMVDLSRLVPIQLSDWSLFRGRGFAQHHTHTSHQMQFHCTHRTHRHHTQNHYSTHHSWKNWNLSTWWSLENYRSVPGKRPLPGKRPCTSFQGVNVAASMQTYGSYVPGKCPWGPKSRVISMGAYPGHYR